jgi:hypothetical protein
MASPASSVVRALTTTPPDVGAADVPALRAACLGGEVRQRLPAGHPLREVLRTDHLRLGARHALIRAELRPLLRLWHQAGVPAMLIKGFALAEFEYSTPGERFYGDVDVLIPDDPDQISQVVHLALAHGWRSDGQHARPSQWTHECAHLYSPDGHIRLDVHRYVTALVAGSAQRVRHLTEAVWAQACLTDWDGLPVWRPSPVDAALVNVALGRCWGGDAGGLKPADYPDLRTLVARHNLTPGALKDRAATLGAVFTWQAFTQVCDPFRQQFSLEEAGTRAALLAGLRRDGYHPRLLLWQSRWHKLPHQLYWVPRVLPDMYWAWRAVRQGGDPRSHLQRWTPPASAHLPAERLDPAVRVVALLTRLAYPRQSRIGTCVPRAYATYRLLRRLGHPAVFVSGVARSASGAVIGHAWVEDDRGELSAYAEPNARQHFRTVFEWGADPA